MSNASFVAAMAPYAHAQATATGLDCRLFLVQWADESTWGTSNIAVNDHNFAGIECPSAGKGCSGCDGPYTKCPSTADFSALYTAIITDSTYAPLRASAGQGLAAQFAALGASPWAAGHYAGSCGTPGCALAQLYADNQAIFDAAACQTVSTGPPPPSPSADLLPVLLVGVGALVAAAAVFARRQPGLPGMSGAARGFA